MDFHKLNTCIISTQIKKQNITSTPESTSHAVFQLLSLLRVTTILTSNSVDQFYLFATLYKWSRAVYTFVSGFFGLHILCDSSILVCIIIGHCCIVFHCICKDITVFHC